MPIDVASWLDSLEIEYSHEALEGGGETWHLLPCPSCGKNAGGKDSSIFREADGRLGWHCFHDTCPAAVKVREAELAGQRLSGWAALCGVLGRPSSEFVTSDRGPYPGGPGASTTRASRPADERPFDFKSISWDELRLKEIHLRWLVPRAFVVGQPILFGGASKTLKTSIAVDLLVAVTGGGQWLGVFDPPPETGPAFFVSGESGEYTLRETISRVCAARGIHEQGLPLTISTRIPRLGVASHVEATRRELLRLGAKVFVLDPAYLAMLGDDSGEPNLFRIGSILREFGEVAEETGATMVLLHHFRKATRTSGTTFTRPTLEEFSFSGFGEWARQWVLLKRRNAFKQGSGIHELYCEVAGSVGQSSAWALTIDEGQALDVLAEGRQWEVIAEPYDELEHGTPGKPSSRGIDDNQLLEIVQRLGVAAGGVTAKAVAEVLELKSDGNIRKRLNELKKKGRLEMRVEDKANVYTMAPVMFAEVGDAGLDW